MSTQPRIEPVEISPASERPGQPRPAVAVGTGPLSIDDVVAVARHGARVELAADAVEAMAASRSIIEALADDPAPHYGV